MYDYDDYEDERRNYENDFDDYGYEDRRCDDGVNWNYYNSSLDMDQQDPEFWD